MADQPIQLTADDLEALMVGTVVQVASVLVPWVPYKKTRRGWQTLSPRIGRVAGKPLTSAEVAERGAWLD